MAKLIAITGTVTELSNSEIGKHWTDYGTVHIRGDDGTVTRIQNAVVTSEMPNALNVGTRGTFHFRKIRTWGQIVGRKRLLAACEVDGTLRTASMRQGIVIYAVCLILSVLLIPIVVGLVAFPMVAVMLASMIRTQRQIATLRRASPLGSEVLNVRTI
ncbi:hypothetical protein [Aureimonas sp. AU40]|uniref:hypothetical protein n=1 Tax=Aureimonas sp. AU40 TaxID=1637747 RepID=UPI000785629C|nr:hypothetical protein [Aureimonas sp. AU40]